MEIGLGLVLLLVVAVAMWSGIQATRPSAEDRVLPQPRPYKKIGPGDPGLLTTEIVRK